MKISTGEKTKEGKGEPVRGGVRCHLKERLEEVLMWRPHWSKVLKEGRVSREDHWRESAPSRGMARGNSWVGVSLVGLVIQPRG